jgi:small conductance mechanosensitive channel
VIGFGAQSMIKDFLAGIFIITEDWYGVGDVVNAGEASGTVEQVTLRSTRLRDEFGTVWHIPNGVIERAGNKSQQWGRAVLDIAVAITTDIDVAQRVIKETADELANDVQYATEIIAEPEVLGVEEIGADRIVIRAIIKTTPASQWTIARELRARIKIAFDAQGIDLPPVLPFTAPTPEK